MMEVQPMKINWKCILIAAICAELVLAVIYVPAKKNLDEPLISIIAISNFIVWLFLGGFWIAGRINSHFILHGALVGVCSNVIWYFLGPIIMGDGIFWRGFLNLIYLILFPFKILPAMVGAYVGGRRRRKQLAVRMERPAG
jgi:putative membrane protein (TIGR04086 family)